MKITEAKGSHGATREEKLKHQIKPKNHRKVKSRQRFLQFLHETSEINMTVGKNKPASE